MSLTACSLEEIYGAEAGRLAPRYQRLTDGFAESFGTKPAAYYRAPGRVEIGGNHTDHQGGVTLSAAIDLDMAAAVRPTGSGMLRLFSVGYGLTEVRRGDTALREEEKGTTAALVRGMLAAVESLPLSAPDGRGLDIYMDSLVPGGSGLSSSAALEILLGTILSDQLSGQPVSPLWLAEWGQRVENDYFGKPCGLLDQLSCVHGGVISVDFGEQTPWIRRVAARFESFGYRLFMIDSGAGHEDLTAEYAAIPAECAAVSAVFGASRLCEVPEEEFMRRIPQLRVDCGDRAVLRAMHFFEENRRALSEAMCLMKGNIDGFLRLVRASGRSSAMYLQNVVPAGASRHQELLLSIALAEEALRGRGAVRVHGGGFGGTAEAFVPEEMAGDFVARVECSLGAGRVRELHICPCGGVKVSP